MESESRFENRFQSGVPVIAVVTLLAVGASVLTVLILGGDIGHLVWALPSGILLAGTVGGAYGLGRKAGQPHSHAVALSAIVFGVMLLATVVAELLRSSGQISDFRIGVGLVGAVIATLVVLGIVAVVDRATAAS